MGADQHRDVRQSETKASEERYAVARRVRTADENENRECLENSGLFNSVKKPKIKELQKSISDLISNIECRLGD